MKGQERLDKCMASGLIEAGTRFLYRNHGIATGRLWEGQIVERVVDEQDGNRTYVRLDDSGEWELPENIFVELIFPALGKTLAPDSPAANATSAPAGDNQPLTPPADAHRAPLQEGAHRARRQEAEEVPIHQQTTKTTKTTQRTKAT